MMKKSIESLLSNLQILPISNAQWRKFDICLYSSSIYSEYSDVKRKIRDFVPKEIGGIYLIKKNDKTLYVGVSSKNISKRLNRHIDKIYIRNDSRSDFFKLKEYQGYLSIYYWAFPPYLIEQRHTIEELLTILLEPEYKKWLLKNKMIELEKAFQEDSNSTQTKKQDKLLKSKAPTNRMLWEKFIELDTNHGTDGKLMINLGADDPIDLKSAEALEFAKKIAKRKGYSKFYKAEEDIRLYGQNCLTERMFFFQKSDIK